MSLEEVQATLESFLRAMGASFTGVERTELVGQQILSIKAADGVAFIGSHGDTLHAIDFLVKKIVEKAVAGKGIALEEGGEHESGPHFLIDVDEYRTKQIKDLQTKALMMAERARNLEYDVELSPMSSYERLIVHTALQNEPKVKTESQGEGRNRRIVIKYAAE